jgi:predicted PolB exonuclease-like 3'-5' exonuclease
MDKYGKITSPITPNYVSYYRNGKSVHHSFRVRYNSNNEIDLVYDMEKRVNLKGDWYVNGDGNITKEEFDNVLSQAVQFLTEKEQTNVTKSTH